MAYLRDFKLGWYVYGIEDGRLVIEVYNGPMWILDRDEIEERVATGIRALIDDYEASTYKPSYEVHYMPDEVIQAMKDYLEATKDGLS